MNKVRIAVAGAGLIGQRHVEEIGKSRGSELSAIVDVSPKAAGTARQFGVPLYDSLTAMFAKDKPDGVVLATPNQVHVEQALQCIDAGVAVLVEKPIAHTLTEGIRLCEAAERAKARVLIGHHRIHSPILHKVCEVIGSGLLGPIVGVMGSAVFYKPDDYFDEAPWRRQPGGGPILINMIHEVSSLRRMVGEIIAVQAFTSNSTRAFPVEDTVAVNLRFANGALGTFLVSDTGACAKNWEQTSQENKSYPTYPDEDCYTIIGTNGSLAVPTMRIKYYERKEDRSWWKPFRTRVVELTRKDPLAEQIEHFAAVIRGDAEPLVTARDGLQNLRVTEAIVEAAKTGRTVNIN
jgi:predicted dehydrogenase